MTNDKKHCVLVTGGAGFIGSHTLVELINAGFDVVAVDNFSNSDDTCLKGVEAITGCKIPFEMVDCCNFEAMEDVFKRYEFDSVIHFAAFKAVGESVEMPLKARRSKLQSINKLPI